MQTKLGSATLCTHINWNRIGPCNHVPKLIGTQLWAPQPCVPTLIGTQLWAPQHCVPTLIGTQLAGMELILVLGLTRRMLQL